MGEPVTIRVDLRYGRSDHATSISIAREVADGNPQALVRVWTQLLDQFAEMGEHLLGEGAVAWGPSPAVTEQPKQPPF